MSDAEARSTEEVLRAQYAAYAAMDLAAIDASMPEDGVMHVSGNHPLSGDYRGKAAAWQYLAKVAEVGGGNGGFDVHSITTDGAGHGVALLTGRIGDYVRPVIRIWHVQDGRITEFWDAYLDAAAEDAFWRDAVAGG
jgi:ketosteroid isomerase-like protein